MSSAIDKPHEARIVTLELSAPQTKVFNSRQPLNLDMAGQGAGKSQMIGIIAGYYVQSFPTLLGFIGANTYLQLTQSTLVKSTEVWKDYYQMTKYERKTNPTGNYVIDRTPPAHFKRLHEFKDYNNIISFDNGAVIYIGSLDNWKAHDGKEFAWAHLDETKDTKEEAVTAVILARLRQGGLFVGDDDELIYLPDAPREETNHLRPLNPCWIHTSPAVGQVDWLIEMFALDSFEEDIRHDITRQYGDGSYDFFYKEFGTKSVTIFSTYHNLKNLPSNYIDGRLAVLSQNEVMKFVFGYPFSKTGGEYYPRFERLLHVKEVVIRSQGIKHISIDFNVVPYMTLLAAQIEYKTRYIDAEGVKHDEPLRGTLPIEVLVIEFYKEYCFSNPLNSTKAVCQAFKEDEVGNPTLEVFYYGDAQGNNRVEGLGSYRRFDDLEEVLEDYLTPDSKRVRGANMGVLTRRDLMNRLLEGKIPNVEIYFDVDMKETVRDFEFLKLGVGGKLKEKAKDENGAVYEKIGHTSDCVEYLVCEVLKHFVNENV